VSGHSPELLARIDLEAYYLWEKAGYPQGDGGHFWFEAEKQVLASLKKPSKPKVSRPAAKKQALPEEEEPKSKKKKKDKAGKGPKDEGKKKKKKKKD
jgi:hypothetical protein